MQVSETKGKKVGLSSSQARMLLLTARKSDLEYRAQMISQRKINLAMETQELATKYSNAMSNRTMYLTYQTGEGKDSQTVQQKLDYYGLTSKDGVMNTQYLVVTASGKYAYTGQTDDETRSDFAKVALKLAEAEGKDSQYYNADKTINLTKLYNDYESKMTYVKGMSNADYFQEALRNGGLYVAQAAIDEKTGDAGTFKNISWGSVGPIQDKLDTEDDAQAQAEYEAKTIVLSNQDKMLDLELNQIETQHKAIETEYSSVEKLVQKNIEVTYKIFA